LARYIGTEPSGVQERDCQVWNTYQPGIQEQVYRKRSVRYIYMRTDQAHISQVYWNGSARYTGTDPLGIHYTGKYPPDMQEQIDQVYRNRSTKFIGTDRPSLLEQICQVYMNRSVKFTGTDPPSIQEHICQVYRNRSASCTQYRDISYRHTGTYLPGMKEFIREIYMNRSAKFRGTDPPSIQDSDL
jgi:hypothetical protein